MKDRLARLVPAVEQVLREDAERKAYKVMEEALRESEDRFRKLVQGAPLGIIFLDEQSRYVKVNQAFCHMVGYQEEELIGQTYALLTHPDDLSQSMALATDMLDNKQPGFQLERRYIRKDGQTIWVSSSSREPCPIRKQSFSSGGLYRKRVRAQSNRGPVETVEILDRPGR